MKTSAAMLTALLAVASFSVINVQSFPFDDEWDDFIEEFIYSIYGCQCPSWANPCRGNTASNKVIGCPNTNQFLQCSGQTCSNQTCPSGQVWNETADSCAECSPGYHVNATLEACVCNQGTRPSPINGSCIPCPAGSTEEPDRCFCPSGTIVNHATYACEPCPDESVEEFGQCVCNVSLFWNAAKWACLPCPGTWTPLGSWGFESEIEVCKCTQTGTIFQLSTVTCYTCPSPATPDPSGTFCECPGRGQGFNETSQQCVCLEWDEVMSGNECIRATTTTSTTTIGQEIVG